MEGCFDLLDIKTGSYLKFVLDLTDTCVDTCSVLEKRQISNSSQLDKYDISCLQACTKSYLQSSDIVSEKFGKFFMQGNPYLGPNGDGIGVGMSNEMATENADGRLD